VLNSSDEEIIGLEEDAVVTADEDDDVIDLTDVSEPPLTDEDEILDLTEELQQSETDEDITIAEDDEIMELEDITDVSADTEVAILELDEAIDALSVTKEESVIEEGAATESEEDVIDLHDTVEAAAADSEPATAGPAFKIETDTVELTESDRQELEQEFGFEAEDEGIPEEAPDELQPADEGFLSGTLDTGLDDTLELTETAGDAGESKTGGLPPEFSEEPLELTDEDRATLEEEIGADTAEEVVFDAAGTSEPLPMEENAVAGLEEQIQEPPEPAAEHTFEDEPGLDAANFAPEGVGGDETEPEPRVEAEMRFDAEELSMGDDADEQPVGAGLFPEEETAEPTPDALQQTMELADVNGEALQAEIDREAFESPAPDISIGDEPEAVDEEILDVGLEQEEPLLPDESAAAETDASLAVEGLGLTDEPSAEIEEPDVSGQEAFMIETPAGEAEEEAPLTAESLTGADFGADGEISASADRPSGTTFDSEEDKSAAKIGGATTDGMSVDFDQAENFEQTDMHKDADPISIRVQEPAADDHADEDALLNKVFEPQPDAPAPQDLEQTVERVVGKMLSGKIEAILADAIEKAVEKEIGRLKKLLMDDLNRPE
jgi:hypothetical protein